MDISGHWDSFVRALRVIVLIDQDEVYEVNSRRIVPYESLPKGYSGEAYFRDDPRLLKALVELCDKGYDI